MRNKLIALSSILVLLIVCIAGVLSLKNDKYRYHQHMEQSAALATVDTSAINAGTFAPGTVEMEGFVSHLPLVTIDTHEQEMPGVQLTDYSRIRVTTRFYDSANTGEQTNSLDREPDLESFADVRYRGNSSREFEKKGYSVNLVKENGEENNKSIFGMPSHDEWALHGPYLDKTMLRNYMMYNLSGQIMTWAPNVRFCELFVDGEYRGIYLMVEQISVNEERINLRRTRPSDPFTSYLVEIVSDHRLRPDISVSLNNFSYYTMLLPQRRIYEVNYPAPRNITPTQTQYIEEDISRFERVLYSYDFDDPAIGYRDQINMNSFVDYIILNEISLNYDAGNLSTFIYRDAKGDFDICVWDFNNTFDNYFLEMDSADFYFRSRVWFDAFLRDEEFVERLVMRYKALRKTYLSDEYLLQYIDDTIAYLGPAIERNFTVWGDSFLLEKGLLIPEERNLSSFDDAVDQLKTTLTERTAFMDENIESYYQFCHPSKVKTYNP